MPRRCQTAAEAGRKIELVDRKRQIHMSDSSTSLSLSSSLQKVERTYLIVDDDGNSMCIECTINSNTRHAFSLGRKMTGLGTE